MYRLLPAFAAKRVVGRVDARLRRAVYARDERQRVRTYDEYRSTWDEAKVARFGPKSRVTRARRENLGKYMNLRSLVCAWQVYSKSQQKDCYLA